MESKDIIDFPSRSSTGQTNNVSRDYNNENEEMKGKDMDVGNVVTCIEEGQVVEEHFEGDAVHHQSVVQEIFEYTGTSFDEPTMQGPNEDGLMIPIEQVLKSNHAKSSVASKRPRLDSDKQDPSVHICFTALTRNSKQKLQELLQNWSEWHAEHHSSSQALNEGNESGEMTYFPSLHVDTDNKASSMCFWMENGAAQIRSKNRNSLDADSVPLYDRGFSLGLTFEHDSQNSGRPLEIRDATRCFNCGSYGHALKQCTKPLDNVAVSNARKNRKSKRSHNCTPRVPTRYYQNSPRGRFDDLRPGALGTETRKLLGLGESDPPPWLNRMREIGYPPGYLDPEPEDKPSGITIYTDEGSASEHGEGLGERPAAPKKKMSAEFPGINAPIPENADETLWTHRDRAYSTPAHQGHGRPGNNVSPRSDPVVVRSMYSNYQMAHRGYSSLPRSPGHARLSPLSYDGSRGTGLFDCAPYALPDSRFSPRYDYPGSGSRAGLHVLSYDQRPHLRDRHGRDASRSRR